MMCRLLRVSRSGYYAWRARAPSPRALSDRALTARIRAIHERSRGTYGAPRIHAELDAEGERVGVKRVARLMRAAGLAGVSRRKGIRTTVRDKRARPAPDLVDRNFSAEAPNRLWVADISVLQQCSGRLGMS
jgi:putative transposase